MGFDWKLLLAEVLVLQMAVLESTGLVAAAGNRPRPACPDKCRNISIPYPFGIGEGCFLQGFQLFGCNDTEPTLSIDAEGNLEVADIFLSGRLRVKVLMGRDCYDRSGVNTTTFEQWLNLISSPFTFSDTKNKFTAVGCDTVATIQGTMGVKYVRGCVSFCTRLQG